jgi:hypothetical protein
MTQEALKLALDFVETVHVGEWVGSIERQERVITAIKKALAQPEPCDMGDICIGCSPRNADGSCPSSQRTWVRLTDVEIDYLLVSTAGENEETHISFARAIEAKLKEKNT